MTLAIATPQNASKRAIVTICSNNYFPYARVLFFSLQRYHPEASLFLCLADVHQPDLELGIEGVEVIEARELGIPNFADFAFRYDILEFNTAVKPFILRLLIEERDFEQVVYLDPDIELFAPMTPVFDALAGGADFVLTPHITAPSEFKEFPNDIGVMKAGIYNLGFIALSNGYDVINFLHWWGRRLRFQCLNQAEQGIFVDQKFVDLVPAFYKNVAILRDRTLNVAYWNLDQRRLEQTTEGWFVDGKPLIFFHFSGIIPRNRDRLSKYTVRFDGNLEPALQSLIDRYIFQLYKFGFGYTFPATYYYGTFSNGIPITNLMRRYYQTLEEPWLEDPFETFHNYLNEFSQDLPNSSPSVLTNFMYFLWQQREDWQREFSLQDLQSRLNYAWRFIADAPYLGIDNYFINPVADNRAEHVSNARSLSKSNVVKEEAADVCVVGYLKAEIGVGHAGRMVARSFDTLGVQTQGFNVTVNVIARQEDTSVEALLSSKIEGKVQIYNVNADQLAIVRESVSQLSSSAELIVNMPFWELGRFPTAWIPHYQGIDEIWAPSRFVQIALQTAMSMPVVWMPPAVVIDKFPLLERNKFNLPSDAFLFHFNFDFSSYSTRKNPLAAIEAYRLAFRHSYGEVPTALVIKTRGHDPDGKNLKQLMEFTEEEPDIFIINEQMTYGETLGLMNCCDCYISLHRSEGFGYTLAEAMLLSKPVIATDYSGVKDFLNQSTGFPISYRLKPVNEGEYPFWEEQKWADPDLNHAAWLMRRVVADETNTKLIAKAGREKILTDYSLSTIGKRYFERLRKVGVL